MDNSIADLEALRLLRAADGRLRAAARILELVPVRASQAAALYALATHVRAEWTELLDHLMRDVDEAA